MKIDGEQQTSFEQLPLLLCATTKAHRYLENAVRAKKRGDDLAMKYYCNQAVQPKGAKR